MTLFRRTVSTVHFMLYCEAEIVSKIIEWCNQGTVSCHIREAFYHTVPQSRRSCWGGLWEWRYLWSYGTTTFSVSNGATLLFKIDPVVWYRIFFMLFRVSLLIYPFLNHFKLVPVHCSHPTVIYFRTYVERLSLTIWHTLFATKACYTFCEESGTFFPLIKCFWYALVNSSELT